MSVITRFAPTLSGHMHLGTLYNAFLNYLYAKSNNGLFYVRLDGQQVYSGQERERFGNGILSDLAKFRMFPDKVIWQRDRVDKYNEEIRRHTRDLYVCYCSVVDITKRLSIDDRDVVVIARDEKYPPPVHINHIRIYDPSHKEVKVSEIGVNVPSIMPAENMIDNNDLSWWGGACSGYQGESKIVIVLSFEKSVINNVTITWYGVPLKDYGIYNGSTEIATIRKGNPYCVPQSTVPYERGFTDSISFAPIETDRLAIISKEFFVDVKREYCYDRFCRDKSQRLNWSDKRLVLRVPNHMFDVVVWADGQCDLSFTSAFDDLELGTTHSIRGRDIEPFTVFEKVAGNLIGYRANNLFHPLIVDSRNVKYSKFASSERVTDYFYGFSSESILSYLFWAGGLGEKRLYTLNEMIDLFDVDSFCNGCNIKIDAVEMKKDLEILRRAI